MHTSYARYKCMGALYYKLVAFIPNTKDVWDLCLGGFKGNFYPNHDLIKFQSKNKNLKPLQRFKPF
ncbi:hypothetical protein HPSH_03255 [Helicobacter pylori Shi470]|nr:hypothetical protein HPSH_03255 [Helicobacter pylori Shi470]